MWDEEDRRRRLRRELGGGEDAVFGSYDASGNYVGLTPLQGPSWFTSTLFSNASLYSIDRTQAVVERFLRTTGLAEQERDNETSLGTEAVGETEHAKAKKTLARLAREGEREGEPDLRLADGGAVAQDQVDWSRVEVLVRDPATGKVVLVPLDPPSVTDATTVLAPTVVTVPRARTAASTTGMGVTSSPLDLEDERARALEEKLASADRVAQEELQQRLEQSADDKWASSLGLMGSELGR